MSKRSKHKRTRKSRSTLKQHHNNVFGMKRLNTRMEMHARLRAEQRYGLVLSVGEYYRLGNRIRCKQLHAEDCYLCTTKRKKTLWALNYHGLTVVVVYDRRHHQIVTFLPPSVLVKIKDASDG